MPNDADTEDVTNKKKYAYTVFIASGKQIRLTRYALENIDSTTPPKKRPPSRAFGSILKGTPRAPLARVLQLPGGRNLVDSI